MQAASATPAAVSAAYPRATGPATSAALAQEQRAASSSSAAGIPSSGPLGLSIRQGSESAVSPPPPPPPQQQQQRSEPQSHHPSPPAPAQPLPAQTSASSSTPQVPGPGGSNAAAGGRTDVSSLLSSAHSPRIVSNVASGSDFRAQLASFKSLLGHYDPKVVRQAIRDSWQTCLSGSEFHVSFVADSVIHQTPPEIIAKSLASYGATPVRLAKRDILRFLTAEDLDELADDILSKASNPFMDKVLAHRLETISGQDLVNALARAERLGYDLRDVAEGGGPGSASEHVIPTGFPAAGYPANIQSPVPPPHVGPPQSGVASVKAKWTSRPSSSSPFPPSANLSPRGPPASLPAPQAITKSNPNIVYCVSCHRPCSSYEALLHHSRKAGCQGNAHYQYLSKESCLHCGCQFASAAGRIYHEKFKVCGNYPPEIDNIMSDLLAKLIRTHQSTPSFATPHKTTPVLLPSHVSQYQTPASKAASVVPSQTQTPAQTGTPAGTYHHGPYAHLTPEQRKAFEEEMKASEAFYGDLMKKAMELPAAQQEEELSKIKNRFNTKQSTTRKRYGIRLREKRTQAEIEAERRRLLGDDAPETEIQALKKARVSGDGQAAVTQSAPDPARIHETPRKRVPLTEMGGLAGSQATAEMVDPTGYLLPSNARPVHIRGAAPGANRGTSDDPMQIDDDSEAGNDEDSEEDIPARPPAPQSAQAAGI